MTRVEDQRGGQRQTHERMHVLMQFVKFGIVGISNTLLALTIYTVLVEVVDVWYLAASAIGFVAGAVNGFLLNRRWTFAGHKGDALTPVRWGVVQSCGLLLNLGLVALCVESLGLGKLLGQVVAISIVVVVTFVANRAWTFRSHPAQTAGG